MQYTIPDISDVRVNIDDVRIGGLLKAGYTVTRNDQGAECFVSIVYRPVTNTLLSNYFEMLNSTLVLITPWRTFTFASCKTAEYSLDTDGDGTVVSLKVKAGNLTLS